MEIRVYFCERCDLTKFAYGIKVVKCRHCAKKNLDEYVKLVVFNIDELKEGIKK